MEKVFPAAWTRSYEALPLQLQESDNPVSFASPARPGNAQGKLSAANDVKCFRFLARASCASSPL